MIAQPSLACLVALCVCVHMCAPVCGCICMYLCVHVDVRGTIFSAVSRVPSAPLLLETEYLTGLELTMQAILAREAQNPPVHHPSTGTVGKHHYYTQLFYVDSGDLTLVFWLTRQKSLWTEISLKPQLSLSLSFSFFFKTRSHLV